jgi:hypothetical protein
MRSARGCFDHPPDDQSEREPSGDGLCIQRRLPGRPDCLPARGAMLTCTNLPPTAYAVKPSCRHEYAPVHRSVCPIGESSPSPGVPVAPASGPEPAIRGLDRRFCLREGQSSDSIPCVRSMLVRCR